MAAVRGGGYCSSAGLAARTIMGNVLRVAAVDMVGDALIFLGKLSVMAGSGEPRCAHHQPNGHYFFAILRAEAVQSGFQ